MRKKFLLIVFLRTLLISGSLLLAALSMEVFSRFLDYVTPLPARTWQEHRLAIPPPYENAPYDVYELVEEAQKVQWTASESFGWLPHDHVGKYINIADGKRVTTEQPNPYKQTVWIFGGSTVMGCEVPDMYTMPSYLQRIMNEKNSGLYRVMNMGATTITSKHQLWRLNNTKILSGDVVVFFDGVNDIIQSLYYKNPDGSMVAENRQTLQKKNIITRLRLYVSAKYSGVSSFVRRFVNPYSPEPKPIAIKEKLRKSFAENYLDNITKASLLASEKNCTFIHVLQPCLYSISNPTKYESRLMANGWLYPSELRAVFAVGYPLSRQQVGKARELGVSSYDLSNAFDHRKSEIFLDFCHVNHVGNEILAERIAELIK